jgi:rubrerythrin
MSVDQRTVAAITAFPMIYRVRSSEQIHFQVWTCGGCGEGFAVVCAMLPKFCPSCGSEFREWKR